MKLIYFELENFLSIYNATGLHKLSFNREDSPNRLILILGANGSGKSSILDELSPLPLEHTNFRNKSRVIKNKIGKKILIFKVDNIYYKCEIIYEKKTICYFKVSYDNRTWEEMNQNGNVSTYVELLEQHLGFSKNYVKVGYLSSAISNFIVMKPSERNEYISEWLPNIDIYLRAHKLITTKHNQKKREIDNINKELGKLSTIDYENEINILEKNRQELIKSKEDLIKKNTILETYLNKLIDKNNYFNRIPEYKRDILNNGNIIKKNIEEYNSLKEIYKEYENKGNDLNYIQNAISEVKIELAKYNEIVNNNKLRILKLAESIEKKSINNITTGESLDSIETRIKYTEKEIEDFNLELKSFESINNRFFTMALSLDSSKLSIVTSLINNISFYSKNIKLLDRYLSYNDYQIAINETINSIDHLKKEIENNNKEIDRLNKIVSMKDNTEELNRLYNLHPSHCSVNTCNLLKELSVFIKTNENNSSIKLKEAMELTKDKNMKDLDHFRELYNDLLVDSNDLNKLDNLLIDNREDIDSLPEELGNIFKVNIKEIPIKEFINNINNLLIEVEFIRSVVKLNERLKASNDELNQLNALKIKIINKSQLNEEYKELEKLKVEISEYENLINTLEKKKETLYSASKIKEDLENMIKFNTEQLNKYRQNVKDFKSICLCKYYYSHMKKLKVDAELDLVRVQKQLEEIESKSDRLKSENFNKNKLEQIRNEGLILLRKFKVLSDTWSPKIGYASWEISAFLDILKDQTNRDLKEMWGSELKIDSFNVDLNEFSIKINKNGNIIDDAILCSSGEQATLVTAISFAIIALNATSKKYNILRLDEVDAVLDSTKRRGFMDILMDRIEKMNCQSCFVVSHNNEFDTVEADVILMSDYREEMNLDNKNIIFKI